MKYILTYKNIKNKNIFIDISKSELYQGKNSLQDIDKFTMQFSDSWELKDYLCIKGIILPERLDNELMIRKIDDKGNFKSLGVLYNDSLKYYDDPFQLLSDIYYSYLAYFPDSEKLIKDIVNEFIHYPNVTKYKLEMVYRYLNKNNPNRKYYMLNDKDMYGKDILESTLRSIIGNKKIYYYNLHVLINLFNDYNRKRKKIEIKGKTKKRVMEKERIETAEQLQLF